MKPPSEEDLLNELFELVRRDPLFENIDVVCQPGVFRLQIGGQAPPWEYQVDKRRLKPGSLSVYATEIVDEWAEATGRAAPSR